MGAGKSSVVRAGSAATATVTSASGRWTGRKRSGSDGALPGEHDPGPDNKEVGMTDQTTGSTDSPMEQLKRALFDLYYEAGRNVTYITDSGEPKPYWANRYLQGLKRAVADSDAEVLAYVTRLVMSDEPSRGFGSAQGRRSHRHRRRGARRRPNAPVAPPVRPRGRRGRARSARGARLRQTSRPARRNRSGSTVPSSRPPRASRSS